MSAPPPNDHMTSHETLSTNIYGVAKYYLIFCNVCTYKTLYQYTSIVGSFLLILSLATYNKLEGFYSVIQ